MTQVQKAWKEGGVAAALMMDVKAAFPSVSRDCLMSKMRKMELNEDLVQWTGSFLSERRVRMVVDGQEGEEFEITTGLPQGSPASPILFAVYLAEIHDAVTSEVEGSMALSFVDDVTWLVVGENVAHAIQRLESCARRALGWAEKNAVEFEVAKTEAILFSKKKKHARERVRQRVRVGDRSFHFNKEATRWLGVWLDSSLTLRENQRRCIGRARRAEARLRRLVGGNGIPPASARALQMAIIHGSMLYGTELTWMGQREMAREFQLVINRMARGTTGCFRDTPLAIITQEAHTRPAEALLDYRQARYAQRLLRQPRPRDRRVRRQEGTSLTDRLKAVTHLDPDDECERGYHPEGMRFPGRTVIPQREEALRVADEWQETRNTAWTDGSRQENGGVGAAVAWFDTEQDRWTGEGWHLGNNKEVFDAEVYTVFRAVRRFAMRDEEDQWYTIFADSSSAIKRCVDDTPGPGQALARAIIRTAEGMASSNSTITVRWVPAHSGIIGNETADTLAYSAAKERPIRRSRRLRRDNKLCALQCTASFAHLARRSTEARARATHQWIEERLKGRRGYKRPGKVGIREALRRALRGVATRFFQLLSGHAPIASFLHDRWRTMDTDKCWWCDTDARQTRHHLFTECQRWETEIREMWRDYGEARGWKRPRIVAMEDFFADEAAVAEKDSEGKVTMGPLLRFLESTHVGKWWKPPPPPDDEDGGGEECSMDVEA